MLHNNGSRYASADSQRHGIACGSRDLSEKPSDPVRLPWSQVCWTPLSWLHGSAFDRVLLMGAIETLFFLDNTGDLHIPRGSGTMDRIAVRIHGKRTVTFPLHYWVRTAEKARRGCLSCVRRTSSTATFLLSKIYAAGTVHAITTQRVRASHSTNSKSYGTSVVSHHS